ncbi:peptidoglycan DD-metalloendopeptidase family protein [Candidatus Parcubacteria bacterium]|jgi:murein DD-endopeptidase MepM/ murein hydrolase activator NlpD|nr:peptidoglycan DD-metalloendopeptidase family protein [Candidatus Parcubacteria bacterium]
MKYVIIGIIIVSGLFLASRFIFFDKNDLDSNLQHVNEAKAEPLDREVVVEIESGRTFSDITEEVGIGGTLMHEILTASEEVYDLVKVRVGREMKFYFDKETDEFKQLIYPVDTEEELYITVQEDASILAERKTIEYEIRVKTVGGSIESSLYESAVEQGIDIRAIIDLADVFAWTVDFGMGIRQGDTYSFIFEERYRNGEYIMPGQIIAARFVNDGKNIEGYYFNEGEDEEGLVVDGYFDLNGDSLQKIFLKNPVSFKYISSNFTTGRRYVEAFNVSTGHRAIDYAAAAGTPIRAVGDGQVTSAGWNSSGYGNRVSVRHNSLYSTNYAHMSKIYVKYGQQVQQGDVIGAVGSTGFSTGPHLHFEMVKSGTKINPLTVDLPSDKAVSEDRLGEFQEYIKQWQVQL